MDPHSPTMYYNSNYLVQLFTVAPGSDLPATCLTPRFVAHTCTCPWTMSSQPLLPRWLLRVRAFHIFSSRRDQADLAGTTAYTALAATLPLPDATTRALDQTDGVQRMPIISVSPYVVWHVRSHRVFALATSYVFAVADITLGIGWFAWLAGNGVVDVGGRRMACNGRTIFLRNHISRRAM
jgi:hypothetical protein